MSCYSCTGVIEYFLTLCSGRGKHRNVIDAFFSEVAERMHKILDVVAVGPILF